MLILAWWGLDLGLFPTKHKWEGEGKHTKNTILTWFGQQCLQPQGEKIFISLMREKIHNNGLVSRYKMIIPGPEPPFFSSSSLSLFFLFPSLFAMCPPCFSLLFFLLFCFFSLHGPNGLALIGLSGLMSILGLLVYFFYYKNVLDCYSLLSPLFQ